MGTGKSGRYLSTAGGRNQVSDYALVHAWEGTYTYLVGHDGKRISKLKSGGHGQKAIELMREHGIRFEIEKTLPNGVRLGRIEGLKKSHRLRANGFAWFPLACWPEDVRRAGEYVAKLPANRKSKDGERVYGVYHGVRVGIIRRGGVIRTVFPDFEQPEPKKKGKKSSV